MVVVPALAPSVRVASTARRSRVAPALVDAAWLASRIGEVVVLDVRRGAEFQGGTIPGARSLPLATLLVTDTARPAVQAFAQTVQRTLAALGVAPDDEVVLIDDADGCAALSAVLCELAGLHRVSVVAGRGVRDWAALGGPITPGGVRDIDAVSVERWAGVPASFRGIAAFEDVVDAVTHHTAQIVDVRSQLEHEGILGSTCCAARGAITGSVHLEWTAFLDAGGHPRSAERVRTIAEHVGLHVDAPVILACHAGHRAAVAALALRAAGFVDVRVSIGSWHDWAARGLADDDA